MRAISARVRSRFAFSFFENPKNTSNAILRNSSLARATAATIELLENRTMLSTVVVNNATDNASGAGIITLRDAIATANAANTPTTITFDPTAFASLQTITQSGTPYLLTNTSAPITIVGSPAGVVLDGADTSSIFTVAPGATATISNLTITNGHNDVSGGGVVNDGTLTLTGVTITDCNAAGGGGLYNQGTATLVNDTISGNTVTLASQTNSSGGGISNGNGTAGTITVDNCTIDGNTSYGGGGGIANNASSASAFTIGNSIVADNLFPSNAQFVDAMGSFNSQGNNLIGNSTSSSGWISSDQQGSFAAPLEPEIGALANNGGPRPDDGHWGKLPGRWQCSGACVTAPWGV